MASLKSAYLIHGDDHGRIAERRANFRKLAEDQSGANGLEIFEGDTATPSDVAAALGAMTFSVGWRFILVEGVERWKGAELGPVLDVFKTLPDETTVALFGREEGRWKVPDSLKEAVIKAGGDVVAETCLKPWELPKWLRSQATQSGLRLSNEAAQLLVARIGDRQQRLLRELEKLKLCFGTETEIGVAEVDQLTSNASERKAWGLADSVVAGDSQQTVRLLLELLAQGQSFASLVYPVAGRTRAGLDIAVRSETGEPRSDIKRSLRMPPRAADTLIDAVTARDLAELKAQLINLHECELATRGAKHEEPETLFVRSLT